MKGTRVPSGRSAGMVVTPSAVQKLVDKLIACGTQTGETLWQLPLVEDYEEDIKSSMADIRNIGLAAGLTIASLPGEPARRPYDIAMAMLAKGYYVRFGGDTIQLAPPFISTREQIDGIAVPDLDVDDPGGDAELLILGWGGTFGPIGEACRRARQRGVAVAHAHLRHLNPFPANLGDVLRRYGVDAETFRFDDYTPAEPFRLLYAAQAWHWVPGTDRYDRAAAALARVPQTLSPGLSAGLAPVAPAVPESIDVPALRRRIAGMQSAIDQVLPGTDKLL